MTADIIDGKAFAATIREKVAGHVSRLKAEHGITIRDWSTEEADEAEDEDL